MYKAKDHSVVYSPSDLTRYQESPFASWMERFRLEFPDQAPAKDPDDPMLKKLQDEGIAHEERYLQVFAGRGLSIATIEQNDKQAEAKTLQAMQSGADVIYQGYLTKGQFKGYSDFLLKVPGASNLGDYHYEAWDTKLAKSLKPYFVIQLCCYSEMLEAIQDRLPTSIVVVTGDQQEQRLRLADFYAFYQQLKKRFLEAEAVFNPDVRPDPADSHTWGNWQTVAEQILVDRDDLSLIARITRSQVKKLNKAGINTAEQLINSELETVSGMQPEQFAKIRKQARLQKQSQGKTPPEFELIQYAPGEKQGLALLPPKSPLDVFFDIEGYPLLEGGLEYLWGNTYFDEQGERQFKDFWAFDQTTEKQAFKAFIDWVYARWQQDPTMHIYHYANYEIAACRRLMGRYGVCEEEVDQLLRNEVFVDLYKIVTGAMFLGEPKYSIKNVEHLYRPRRETEVGSGGESVVVFANWLAEPDGSTWQDSKILNDIRDYNIDDCNSTQELVDWLRAQQIQAGISYLGKEVKEEKPLSPEIQAKIALRDRLLTDSLEQAKTNKHKARLTENLAWILEFHRREAKPIFWELFDRLGKTDDELYDDLGCIAYCKRTKKEPYKLGAKDRNLCYEYIFDINQEYKDGGTENFYILGADNLKIKAIKEESNIPKGLITFKTGFEPPHLMTLVPDSFVNPDPIRGSIEAIIRNYEQNDYLSDALKDFLNRYKPRVKMHQGDSLINLKSEKTKLEQIIQIISNLDNSYLPIQGPPGTGKTYTASHVITDLIRQGKRIGISSNSHKAINHLLIDVAENLEKNKLSCQLLCSRDTDEALHQYQVIIAKNKDIADSLNGQACVVGTTAWGFASEGFKNQFDYLFIDEAGQVSVANLVGMSQSAANLVLMGDQMQLGQPIQGTHPADSGMSILDYLLHDQATVSDNMGIFLDTTYRMHPDVNQFISDMIYEGKLHCAPGNERQVLATDNSAKFIKKQSGIVYIPVEHQGNTQASDEEVQVIQQITQELIGRIYTDKEGKQKSIDLSDILYVAPYNHQVNKIRQALGDRAKVGSVDKFQGQEAPVVILSMCASDPNESPRGLSFLLDKNRMNVAISRAKTLAIVVGNPAIGNVDCNKVEQIKMVNLFCEIKEYLKK